MNAAPPPGVRVEAEDFWAEANNRRVVDGRSPYYHLPRQVTGDLAVSFFDEDFANQPFDRPLSRERAFEILLKTDTFANVGVGYFWRLSTQVEAFRIILGQPDAAEAFHDLLARGRLAGQLYALCGLYLTDRAAFNAEVATYVQSSQQVKYSSGCVTSPRPVASLVKEFHMISGGYPRRFEGP